MPYLKQQGIGRLEGIFVTHPDMDHINGIQEIFRAVARREIQLSVGNLLLPEWMRGTEGEKELIQNAVSAGAAVRYLSAGDTILSGNCRIEVLYPEAGTEVREGEENGASLVLGIHSGGFDGLLTGDLEGEGESELSKTAGQYDYLKVAHHGSRSSTGEEFLAGGQARHMCDIRPGEQCLRSSPSGSIGQNRGGRRKYFSHFRLRSSAGYGEGRKNRSIYLSARIWYSIVTMDKLFIIIPAYNEEANIRKVLDEWYPIVEGHSGGENPELWW